MLSYKLLLLLLTILVIVQYAVLIDAVDRDTSISDAEDALRREFKLWLIKEVRIVGKQAAIYVDQLFDAGIGSVEKLSKKISKDKLCLTKLGFDETDSEDIIAALSKLSNPPSLDGSLLASAAVQQPISYTPILANHVHPIEAVELTRGSDTAAKYHHHHHNHKRNFTELMYNHKECIDCVTEMHHIALFSVFTMVNLLEERITPYLDSNSTVVILRSTTNQTAGEIASVIDEFVAPRPWWMVEAEPYPWMPHSRDVVLLRVPQKVWKHLNAVSKHHYRTEYACSTAPLTLSGHTHDAWGNRIQDVYAEWGGLKQAIFLVYTSVRGRATDSMGFVEGSVCPDLVNKWECVFLPSTNCSRPQQLVDCRNQDCIPRMTGSTLFSNASVHGIAYTPEERSVVADYIRKNVPIPTGLHETGECLRQRLFHSRSAATLLDASTTIESKLKCHINVIKHVFVYGFLFRFNSDFRSRINQRMLSFRKESSPPFSASEPCVSAHVRMHDRAIPGVDMVKYCHNCTIFDEDGGIAFNCSAEQKHNWYDNGCCSFLPFGAVTLQHVINASRVLRPNNRNLFIMTDDAPWLNEQVALYNQRQPDGNTFKIFAFPAAPNHRLPSASATVDFWASVKLAQQCDAFVGHFSSAATGLVYNAMCFSQRVIWDEESILGALAAFRGHTHVFLATLEDKGFVQCSKWSLRA